MRGWTWIDQVDVGPDSFPERYRIRVAGPGGELERETTTARVQFGLEDLPANHGETIEILVTMVGPMALSHALSATIIL